MKVIDLSLTVNNEMPGVAISPARTIENDGWTATNLNLYSHSGTHMDAPAHFVSNAATLDEQDLSVLVGPAILINLAPVKPSQLITIQDFEPVESSFVPGCRVLIRTDWSKQYGTKAYRDELPRISADLAKWLVARDVALIGVEPPSVADVNCIEEVTEVHKILFDGNIVIVEGLKNLDQISKSDFEFIALPLKIENGDGCPVRAIAIEK